jgi:hypothetical protein
MEQTKNRESAEGVVQPVAATRRVLVLEELEKRIAPAFPMGTVPRTAGWGC